MSNPAANPVFTLTQAQTLLGTHEAQAANAWILANKDANEFAGSLASYYARNNGLTVAQWTRAHQAANGVTFKRKSKGSTAAAPAPAAAAPAPAASAPAAPTHNSRTRLSPADRAIARKAIAAAPGWASYSKARQINTANLSGETLFIAADDLGVDVAAAIAAARNTARASAGAAFGAVGTAEPAVTGLSRQDVRTIAREEITARLEPQIKTVVVIERPGAKPANTGSVTHPKFDQLARAAVCRDFSGNRLNVLLVGPTGTGKSYACKQLAEAMGLDFYFQSQADESFALVGYERVNGTQKYTPFVTAFRDGGVCLLDELDRYSPKALTALNAALANGRMTLDNGEVINRHPDFVCVGAANTMGMGASHEFTAAEKLDLSTISRFSVRLDWHVCQATEDAIAAARADNAQTAAVWLAEIRKVRAACERLDLPYLADQRAVESGANLLTAGLPLQDVREVTYLAPLTADQRQAILAIIER